MDTRGGGVCPCLRAIYMNMPMIFKYFSLKLLGKSKPNLMLSFLWKCRHQLIKKNLYGHMTKMALMAIYGESI